MGTRTPRSALDPGAGRALVGCSETHESASELRAGESSTEEIVAAFEWLEENRGNLPTTYADLDRLPRMHRHAALDALPLDTASALVRERIRRCAAAAHFITEEQREAIASTVETLSSAWYRSEPAEREAMKHRAFWPRTRAVLTWAEWGRIFGDVGHESSVYLAPWDSHPSECAGLVGW